MANTNEVMTQHSAFRLGEAEVRPGDLVVVVNGEERRVEPKVMDLLLYGSLRTGQLLSKEQIMSDVWGGTHLVPEAVQRVVSLLRKALGDSPDAPIYVETVSKRGYKFLLAPVAVAGVEEVNLREPSIQLSPLTLVLASIALIALTWIGVILYPGNEAPAPEADVSASSSPKSDAPPPDVDD